MAVKTKLKRVRKTFALRGRAAAFGTELDFVVTEARIATSSLKLWLTRGQARRLAKSLEAFVG